MRAPGPTMARCQVLVALAILVVAMGGDRPTSGSRLPGGGGEIPPGAVWVTEAGGVDMAAAALLLGTRRGGRLDAGIAVLPAEKQGEECAAGFWIEVRGSDLLGGQSSSIVRLEAFVYGLGADNEVVGFWGRTLHMSLAAVEGRVAQSGVRIAGSVGVPCRAPVIRFLVRNPATSASAVGGSEVVVAGGPDDSLLQCVFPSPAGHWVDAPAHAGSSTGAVLETADVLPLTSRPVLGTPDVLRFAVVGPERWTATTSVTGRLRSASGNPVPGGSFELVSVRRTGGGAAAVEADWSAPAIEPGSYALEVRLEDATGLAALSSPVHVELVDRDGTSGSPVWSELPRRAVAEPDPADDLPVEG